MVDVAVIYGADRKRATKELKDSLEFEMELARVIHLSQLINNFNRLIYLNFVDFLAEGRTKKRDTHVQSVHFEGSTANVSIHSMG